MTIVTATVNDMQKNFDRYLNMILDGKEVIVTKNGEEIARLIPKDATVLYLTDTLTGILREDIDLNSAREERLADLQNHKL